MAYLQPGVAAFRFVGVIDFGLLHWFVVSKGVVDLRLLILLFACWLLVAGVVYLWTCFVVVLFLFGFGCNVGFGVCFAVIVCWYLFELFCLLV